MIYLGATYRYLHDYERQAKAIDRIIALSPAGVRGSFVLASRWTVERTQGLAVL